MIKKSHRTGLAGAAAALALLGGITPAAAHTAGSNGGWDRIATINQSQQWSATTATQPLLGDFNGDGRDDVFMYGPSTGADALWLGKPVDPEVGPTTHRFHVVAYSIKGTYQPLVGDFDGNGSDDIFWYGPGSTPDSLWYFDAQGRDSIATISVKATYRPIVGNFDSADTDSPEEKDDILWWGLTSGPRLWSGQANRTFQKRVYDTEGAKPMAQTMPGNFMPDSSGADGGFHLDLFVYTPGAGTDFIWKGDGTGAFTKVPKTINSTYIPIVGDFDTADGTGFGLTDIMWYAPGRTADTVWMNKGNVTPGTFQATPVAVNGTYQPFVIPGLLGQDSILWNNPTGPDAMWEPSGWDGVFTHASVGWPGLDMGTRTPLVGMFDDMSNPENGDFDTWGPDVLWMSLGDGATQTEVFWRGHDEWMLNQ